MSGFSRAGLGGGGGEETEAKSLILILFSRSLLEEGEESTSKEINFHRIISHDSSSPYALRVLKIPYFIHFYYLYLFSKLHFKTLALKDNKAYTLFSMISGEAE